MKAQVIENLPERDYHLRPEISSSMVREYIKSPRHYWYRFVNPDCPPDSTDSVALRIGSAVHKAFLEPERYEHDVVVSPSIDRRTKAGKEIYDDFVKKSEGKIVLNPDESEVVLGVNKSLREHKFVKSQLLPRMDRHELTVIFTFPNSNVKCRARFDALCTSDGIIIDLKTTEAASPHAFTASINKYRYDIQAAFYSVAYMAVFNKAPKRFYFLAAEKRAPYMVGIYEIEEKWQWAAYNEIESALFGISKSQQVGVYYGYNEDMPKKLYIPRWKEIEIEGGSV